MKTNTICATSNNSTIGNFRSRSQFVKILATMVLSLMLLLTNSIADDAPATKDGASTKTPKSDAGKPDRNATMKTLGGRQFFGDVFFFHKWRIQHNVFTNTYRLLDGEDFQHATGTYDECRAAMEKIREKSNLPPMKGKAVILLHGIIRSSKSMNKFRKPLEDAGYTVFSFDYPSTRVSIEKSADYLNRAIESMKGIDEISFIGHSLGGLVTRAYLKKYDDERVYRVVMLGTPNKGAMLAGMLKRSMTFRLLLGMAGQQLAKSEGTIKNLPAPDCEFAIIAGVRGTNDGFNPILPGDDDGVVSLESALLPGATDSLNVRSIHSLLPHDKAAISAAVRFIKDGSLRENGQKRPVKEKNDQ